MPQAHNSFGLQADRVPYLYVRLLEKVKLNSRLKCSKSIRTGLFRSCSLGTNRVGLVGFFTCSIGNQPFSVGSVDQLFQPTRNPVEMVENDGYRPLSQIVGSYPLRNINKRHLV